MATAIPESIDQHLKCPSCLTKLTNPKALQCLHFFCDTCVQGMKSQGDASSHYLCAICDKRTTTEKLRDMAFVFDVLEAVTAVRNEPKCCLICQGISTQHCEDCKEDYCGTCREVHDKIPTVRNHSWIELSDSKEPIVDKVVYCSKHADKLVEVFCKECNALICFLCSSIEHRNHDIETADDALKRKQSTMNEQKVKLDGIIKKNEQTLNTFINHSENMKKGYEDIEADIDKEVTKAIKQIQEEGKKAKEELNDIRAKHVAEMAATVKQIERTITCGKNCATLGDIVLNQFQGMSQLRAIHSDVSEYLEDLGHNNAAVKPIMTGTRARFVKTNKEEMTLLGSVLDVSDTCIDQQFSDVIKITPTLEKEIKTGYTCYRFAKFGDKLYCVQHNTNELHVHSLDGEKLKTIEIEHVGHCRSVLMVHKGILLAATNGIYQIDMNGIVQGCVVKAGMCDVCVVGDKMFGLDDTSAKVHTLTYEFKSNTYAIQKEFRLANYTKSDRNTIEATSKYIYVANFYVTSSNILQYNHDGAHIATHGSHGSSAVQLIYPLLCGVDQCGTLLVSDKGNNRLKTLNSSGDWQCWNIKGISRPTCQIIHQNKLYLMEEGFTLLEGFMATTLKVFVVKTEETT